MFRRVVNKTRIVQRNLNYASLLQPVASGCVSIRFLTNVKEEGKATFDTSLLDYIVCPLSKKQLRYEVKTNELINEDLGIAYPIIDGIPNMIPQDARLMEKHTDKPAEPTQG